MAGFSALGTPSWRASARTVGLAHPGLEQRMAHAVLGRRPQARPPVARRRRRWRPTAARRSRGGPRAPRACRRARSCSSSSGRGRCGGSPRGRARRSRSSRARCRPRRPPAAAPSSSPAATAGDTAVTASARGPSARAATAATSDESTPPENATTALPWRATLRSSVGQQARSSRPRWCAAASACAHTVFTGAPLRRAARSQSACSGARLTTCPSSRPTFTRTGSPATSTVRLSRSSSMRSRRAIADAQRARLAQHRARDGLLVARPGERGQHEARAPVLHLRRGRPDVERARGDAGRGRVGHELGQQVVEVRLDQRDRPGGGAGLGAEDRPHEVGPLGAVARAGAVADGLERQPAAAVRSRRPARRPAPRPSASRARASLSTP